MTFLISTREGRLCLDGKRLPLMITRSKLPPNYFESGNFSLDASLENIKLISQCFTDLYIIPKWTKVLHPLSNLSYRRCGFLSSKSHSASAFKSSGLGSFFIIVGVSYFFLPKFRNLASAFYGSPKTVFPNKAPMVTVFIKDDLVSF